MKLFDMAFFCDNDNRMVALVDRRNDSAWPVALHLHTRLPDGDVSRVVSIYMMDMKDIIALRDHLVEVTKEPAHEES